MEIITDISEFHERNYRYTSSSAGRLPLMNKEHDSPLAFTGCLQRHTMQRLGGYDYEYTGVLNRYR